MPISEVSGLILAVRNVGGRVVSPSKFLPRSYEIIDWPSDIARLNVELIPMFFRTKVKTSFSLPNPVDENMFDDVHS
eukprot:1568081-Heterocapsa_arctica.AAC.1